ncbi:hypothetical protein CEXT_752231 [Caerostris extrusa]|uniref:Uncharacterized protein n=1 Tax=Caerostris extrusa TaxID=172846 RepID=A0AAV4QI61_CAEEX|nr:hypothetical protein CEXT_752231 [Caerostris extrusa]
MNVPSSQCNTHSQLSVLQSEECYREGFTLHLVAQFHFGARKRNTHKYGTHFNHMKRYNPKMKKKKSRVGPPRCGFTSLLQHKERWVLKTVGVCPYEDSDE